MVSAETVLQYATQKAKEYGYSVSPMKGQNIVSGDDTKKSLKLNVCFLTETINVVEDGLQKENVTWKDYIDAIIEHATGRGQEKYKAIFSSVYSKIGINRQAVEDYLEMFLDILEQAYIFHNMSAKARQAWSARNKVEYEAFKREALEVFQDIVEEKMAEEGLLPALFIDGLQMMSANVTAEEIGIPKEFHGLAMEIRNVLETAKDEQSIINAVKELTNIALKIEKEERVFMKKVEGKARVTSMMDVFENLESLIPAQTSGKWYAAIIDTKNPDVGEMLLLIDYSSLFIMMQKSVVLTKVSEETKKALEEMSAKTVLPAILLTIGKEPFFSEGESHLQETLGKFGIKHKKCTIEEEKRLNGLIIPFEKEVQTLLSQGEAGLNRLLKKVDRGFRERYGVTVQDFAKTAKKNGQKERQNLKNLKKNR